MNPVYEPRNVMKAEAVETSFQGTVREEAG